MTTPGQAPVASVAEAAERSHFALRRAVVDVAMSLVRAGVLVAGVWAGSFLWWLALSLGIGAFRRSIGQHHLAWISRGSGFILFLSGAVLLAATVVKIVAHLL